MTYPRIPRRRSAYIPAGCDQQGRQPATGCFIQAAEAANDIGQQDDEPDFRGRALRALVGYLIVCGAVTGAMALVIFGGLS